MVKIYGFVFTGATFVKPEKGFIKKFTQRDALSSWHMQLISRHIALILILSAAGISFSCKKKDEVKYTERLDMKWKLIEEWKMVNIETKDKTHRFTYVPDHNEVNPKRYIIVMQSPIEQYPVFIEALQKIDTTEKKPDFLFKKTDFSGSHKKHLYIVKVKNHTTVQAVIQGKESFILINYTDYLVEPGQKFINEWTNRWENTKLVTRE